MSRSNPDKEKHRSTNKTILFYGEGLDEETFLKHLRRIYSRNNGVLIKIKRGKGGGSKSLIIQADRILGDFDKKIVVLDRDRGIEDIRKGREEASKRGIKLIEHYPCLEAILLTILFKGQDFKKKSSKWCKAEFESKCIQSKRRKESLGYLKFFPRNLLNKRRTEVPELDKLVSLFEVKG